MKFFRAVEVCMFFSSPRELYENCVKELEALMTPDYFQLHFVLLHARL